MRKSHTKKEERKNLVKEAFGVAKEDFQDWLPPSCACTPTEAGQVVVSGGRWPQFGHLILGLPTSVNLNKAVNPLASV